MSVRYLDPTRYRHIDRSANRMWVDGSYKRDGGAGYAVLHEGVVYWGALETAGSLQTETSAIWTAIDRLPRPVTIYSDSTGAIAGDFPTRFYVRYLPRRSTLELELVDHYSKQGAVNDGHFQVQINN